MSKTLIDQKEVIHSGSAIVKQGTIVDVILTYADDTAQFRFKFVTPEAPPFEGYKRISDNEVEITLILRKEVSFLATIDLTKAGEFAKRDLWMGFALQGGGGDGGVSAMFYYVFALGEG
jgi:hypothetical protein